MILLGAAPVDNWSKQAYAAARQAGYDGTIVISDGFLPPADFIGIFPEAQYPGYLNLSPCFSNFRLMIDMHNYVSCCCEISNLMAQVIFNSGNLAQTHQEKIGL